MFPPKRFITAVTLARHRSTTNHTNTTKKTAILAMKAHTDTEYITPRIDASKFHLDPRNHPEARNDEIMAARQASSPNRPSHLDAPTWPATPNSPAPTATNPIPSAVAPPAAWATTIMMSLSSNGMVLGWRDPTPKTNVLGEPGDVASGRLSPARDPGASGHLARRRTTAPRTVPARAGSRRSRAAPSTQSARMP